MEQAVASYIEKANNFIAGDRVVTQSEYIVPSEVTHVPSVSEFRCSPSEIVGEQRAPVTALSEIVEDNKLDTNMDMPQLARHFEPLSEEKLIEKLDDDDLLALD
jgi:hypothetical protein